jgi:hypothetical protein
MMEVDEIADTSAREVMVLTVEAESFDSDSRKEDIARVQEAMFNSSMDGNESPNQIDIESMVDDLEVLIPLPDSSDSGSVVEYRSSSVVPSKIALESDDDERGDTWPELTEEPLINGEQQVQSESNQNHEALVISREDISESDIELDSFFAFLAREEDKYTTGTTASEVEGKSLMLLEDLEVRSGLELNTQFETDTVPQNKVISELADSDNVSQLSHESKDFRDIDLYDEEELQEIPSLEAVHHPHHQEEDDQQEEDDGVMDIDLERNYNKAIGTVDEDTAMHDLFTPPSNLKSFSIVDAAMERQLAQFEGRALESDNDVNANLHNPSNVGDIEDNDSIHTMSNGDLVDSIESYDAKDARSEERLVLNQHHLAKNPLMMESLAHETSEDILPVYRSSSMETTEHIIHEINSTIMNPCVEQEDSKDNPGTTKALDHDELEIHRISQSTSRSRNRDLPSPGAFASSPIRKTPRLSPATSPNRKDSEIRNVLPRQPNVSEFDNEISQVVFDETPKKRKTSPLIARITSNNASPIDSNLHNLPLQDLNDDDFIDEVSQISAITPPRLSQMSWPSPQRFASPVASHTSKLNTPQSVRIRSLNSPALQKIGDSPQHLRKPQSSSMALNPSSKKHVFSPSIRKLLEEEAESKPQTNVIPSENPPDVIPSQLLVRASPFRLNLRDVLESIQPSVEANVSSKKSEALRSSTKSIGSKRMSTVIREDSAAKQPAVSESSKKSNPYLDGKSSAVDTIQEVPKTTTGVSIIKFAKPGQLENSMRSNVVTSSKESVTTAKSNHVLNLPVESSTKSAKLKSPLDLNRVKSRLGSLGSSPSQDFIRPILKRPHDDSQPSSSSKRSRNSSINF